MATFILTEDLRNVFNNQDIINTLSKHGFDSIEKFYEEIISRLNKFDDSLKLKDISYHKMNNTDKYVGIILDEQLNKKYNVCVIPPKLGTRSGFLTQQIFGFLSNILLSSPLDKVTDLSDKPVLVINCMVGNLANSAICNVISAKILGFNYIDIFNRSEDFGYQIKTLSQYVETISKYKDIDKDFVIDDSNVIFKTERLKGLNGSLTNEPYYFAINAYPALILAFKQGLDIDISAFNLWYKNSKSNKNILAFVETALRLKRCKGTNIEKINENSLQRIYYGAPGTGKSHEIDCMTDKDNSIRTTFHPDSDYASFIGAYKPTMQDKEVYSLDATGTTHKVEYPGNNSQIVYKFIPQAFLKAYVKAWKWFIEDLYTENKRSYYLVIEEINRGNCAQIFGDMFQLLDRSGNGNSSYSISPDMDVQQFLEKDERGFLNLNVDPDYVINNDEGKTIATLKDIKEGTLMVLPSNLHILATMNTSDQSLFPIDSAFKRRWDWEYKKIKDAGKKWKIDFKIDDESDRVDWWQFIQKVNAIIGDMTLSADKQLGYFFCKPDKKNDSQDNEFTLLSQEKFVGKVLFYLWNDVFKDYGFDDASLFKYIDLDSNGKDIERDLAFADFYDDANKINSKIVCHFISNVMKWNKNNQTIQ